MMAGCVPAQCTAEHDADDEDHEADGIQRVFGVAANEQQERRPADYGARERGKRRQRHRGRGR